MAQEKTYLIFVVDDDSKHLLLMKEHLIKHLPYSLNIQTFTSGEEALKSLDKNPDLVILDYFFDGAGESAADGVEILKIIRNKRPNIPVVMMSHQDKIEVAITCYDNGAKDYIIKNETAYSRAQLIVRNIINELKKEEINQEFKAGTRNAYRILAVFILVLLGIIGYLLSKQFSS